MSRDERPRPSAATESSAGPLRHLRVDRRAVLQSLATGVGMAALAPAAAATHVHAAATAARPEEPGHSTGSARVFLDDHAFATLALLCEQIVPGSRAAQVPEFIDRLLEVEALETQQRALQALGAFERAAREAHGRPWASLTDTESTALLTRITALPESDVMRQTFEGFKLALAEIYYSTEPGMKELGWNQGVAFAAPPAGCEVAAG